MQEAKKHVPDENKCNLLLESDASSQLADADLNVKTGQLRSLDVVQKEIDGSAAKTNRVGGAGTVESLPKNMVIQPPDSAARVMQKVSTDQNELKNDVAQVNLSHVSRSTSPLSAKLLRTFEAGGARDTFHSSPPTCSFRKVDKGIGSPGANHSEHVLTRALSTILASQERNHEVSIFLLGR